MEICTCKRKCFEKIPESTCSLIHDGYQNLSTNNEKFLYLYGLIYKTIDRNEPSRSRSLFKYHVRVNGFHVEVCKKAFSSIHGVTLAKIRTLTQKLNDGVIFPQDMRLENLKIRKKQTEKAKLLVKDHINSILRDENVINDIAAGHVPNITKLWEDYKSKYETRNPARHLMDKNQENCNVETSKNKVLSKSVYISVFHEVFDKFVSD